MNILKLFRKYTHGNNDELFEELKNFFDKSIWLKNGLSPIKIKNFIEYKGRIVSDLKNEKVKFIQLEEGLMEVYIKNSFQQVLRLSYKEVGGELIIADIG